MRVSEGDFRRVFLTVQFETGMRLMVDERMKWERVAG